MNQEAQDKLRTLRQRLAELDPYSWEPVEACISKATPLIREFYPKHLAEFERVTARPTVLPPFRDDNFEEIVALSQKYTAVAANTARQAILDFLDGLLELPLGYDHNGDVIMGSKFTTNISGSTVGAIAQGDHAVATGHVTIGTGGPVTQEQHKAAITQAQNALNVDQDALDRIDERLYEALGQFLYLARKIQVEQQGLADVQAKMKETLDEVWAQQLAKGLRPQALPEGLKVIEALAKSPLTAEVAKKLLAGT